MQRQLSVRSRQEVMDSLRARYRSGSREGKCRILDELVAVTGYHRTHAIRLRRRGRGAVAEALVGLWEASDRVGGKRLKALIPTLLDAGERQGHLQLDRAVRMQVLSASAATSDRLLVLPRSGSPPRRRHRSNATTAIRRSVPVRTFAEWGEPVPGFVEADRVAHSGERASGSFAQPLTLTDVASGWTECVALVVRDGALVPDALTTLRRTRPFHRRGRDTDNGREFLNEIVMAYGHDHAIECTRSRPDRKNDQAGVEQTNGSVVRRLVGYRRLEGLAAVGVLARLSAAARLFVTCFQPSCKRAAKTRVGARVTTRYHRPATPSARLWASEAVPEEVKEKLRAVAASLDPLRLLDEIRTMQGHLAELAAGEVPARSPSRDPERETFLKSLRTAWQKGDARPTHAGPPKSSRDWRTRVDPVAQAWPLVRRWLEAEPDRTAKELFHRLRVAHPDTFADGPRQTLQRRIQEWRTAAARRLMLATPSANGLAHDFAPTRG